MCVCVCVRVCTYLHAQSYCSYLYAVNCKFALCVYSEESALTDEQKGSYSF